MNQTNKETEVALLNKAHKRLSIKGPVKELNAQEKCVIINAYKSDRYNKTVKSAYAIIHKHKLHIINCADWVCIERLGIQLDYEDKILRMDGNYRNPEGNLTKVYYPL